MAKELGFAFLNSDGTIDLDAIGETYDAVKHRMLQDSMSWRYEHPTVYNRDEHWEELLRYGSVVQVSIEVV